ncbi:MAG: ABC transporter ATP-binding protein [Actinomycetota bacterium]|nr:ABC transporter ATP-binding protein [Actinomycetota bacterium]
MTTLTRPLRPTGPPYDDPLAPGGPSGRSDPHAGLLVHLADMEVRRGGRPVVWGVDLRVGAGEVVGLVGRNGAGKTTVLRALLGLVPLSRGTVWHRDPCSIGVAFDTVSFPASWSAREGLRCLGDYLGLGPGTSSHVEAVLDRVGLARATRDRRLSCLSHGMRQMVSLAAALVGSPRLVVLDEPHNGLDPLAVHALGRLLRDLADEGRGILLSSHLVDEMDRVCDRVALLHDGRIVLDQRVSELTTCQGWYVEAGDSQALLDLVGALGHTAERRGDGVLVDLTTPPDVAALAASLVTSGAPVSVLRPEQRTLVDVVHTVLGQGAKP